MKKFIVSLIVLTSLISCGKSNKAAGTAATTTTYAVSAVTSVNNDQNFQTLAQAIANNTFTDRSNYYTTYKFGEMTNYCQSKKGFLNIPYQKCSSFPANITSVTHGSVAIETKKAELNAILSKTVSFQGYGSLYTLSTSDNLTYQINTNFPMQSNPVFRMNNADRKSNALISIDINGNAYGN